MFNPVVSIIVPFYASQLTLANTLGSIQDQIHENIEVICVNDGSPDNSREIAESFLVDKRFKVIDQSNRGLAAARNAGMAQSQGEYLIFIDSDDVVLPSHVSDLVACSQNGKRDVCVAPHFLMSTDGEIIQRAGMRADASTYASLATTGEQPNMACSKLYRRAFLEQHAILFPKKRIIYEDLDFTILALLLANEIGLAQRPSYLWLANDGSLSRRFDKAHIDSMQYLLKGLFSGALSKHLTPEQLTSRKLFYWIHIFSKINTYGIADDTEDYLCGLLRKNIYMQIGLSELQPTDHRVRKKFRDLMSLSSASKAKKTRRLLMSESILSVPSGANMTFASLFVKVLNHTVFRKRPRNFPPNSTFAFLLYLTIMKMVRFVRGS
jgi:glycosyltransferase involved in cell wall biosynthesis